MPGTTPFYELYWDGGGASALDETDGSGSTTDSSFHEYVFFNGSRIARRDASSGGDVEYYFVDNVGSTHVLTDSSGNIQEDIDYAPYGTEAYIATETSTNNYKFTRKERDTESGLDYFTARYDASFLGRFTSPDPDNAGAKEEDPQTWNAYSYVRDSPLILTDPTGLCSNGMDDAGGACQTVGQDVWTNDNVGDLCGTTPRCYQASDSQGNVTVTVYSSTDTKTTNADGSTRFTDTTTTNTYTFNQAGNMSAQQQTDTKSWTATQGGGMQTSSSTTTTSLSFQDASRQFGASNLGAFQRSFLDTRGTLALFPGTVAADARAHKGAYIAHGGEIGLLFVPVAGEVEAYKAGVEVVVGLGVLLDELGDPGN
jgi:RHS repeat-associated protein